MKQEQIQKHKYRQEEPEIEELPEPVDVTTYLYAADLMIGKVDEVTT